METTWHVAACICGLIGHAAAFAIAMTSSRGTTIYYAPEQAEHIREPVSISSAVCPQEAGMLGRGRRAGGFGLHPELMSASTMHELVTKRSTNKPSRLGIRHYDPKAKRLSAGGLDHAGLTEDYSTSGWLWSEVLQLFVGLWEGEHLNVKGTYPRFFDADGSLVLIGEEEAERLRQEIEHMRKAMGRTNGHAKGQDRSALGGHGEVGDASLRSLTLPARLDD